MKQGKPTALNIRSVEVEESALLADWLRTKRKEKGHTMRSLAELINTSHSFVGKVEKRERRLDVVEFVRYCNALNIDPYEGLSAVMQQSNDSEFLNAECA
ncbi:helix-turn-helix domain-containing protein [Algicola sagamiensis]|uniref:helix-turn-helix domain-containing protein n=1 Tax=Algicola sagamiensis TaxID=163869 RepID=UPI0003A72E45|nr:helix-turn-helix transcriptional regulator [Algicola sagamiensis]